MNRIATRPLILSLLLVCAGSAFAQEAATLPVEAPAPSATQAAEPAPPFPTAEAAQPLSDSAAVAVKSVPALSISWNCGDCAQTPKIIPLIVERYALEAGKAGYAVSTSETVAADIVDFRQRPPGIRVMFGVMGGKDRLKLKLTYGGVQHTVGDSSANIVQGQNALCADVAEQLYKIMTGQKPKR